MNTATIPSGTVRDLRKKKRIQLVHVAKHQLGLTDDNYRAILSQWKVESSKDMTLFQLGQLLDYLKVLGFRGKPGHKALADPSPRLRVPASPRPKHPSTMQGLRDEIQDLARDRWPGSWEHSLNTLCKKFGVDHVRFLDVTHGKALKQWLLNHAETKE